MYELLFVLGFVQFVQFFPVENRALTKRVFGFVHSLRTGVLGLRTVGSYTLSYTFVQFVHPQDSRGPRGNRPSSARRCPVDTHSDGRHGRPRPVNSYDLGCLTFEGVCGWRRARGRPQQAYNQQLKGDPTKQTASGALKIKDLADGSMPIPPETHRLFPGCVV